MAVGAKEEETAGAAVSNVKSISGGAPVPESGTPNPQLVAVLKDMLAMAESGELQSFVGTGFTTTKHRVALWADHHPDTYQMLGAVAWLQSEYIARHAT